VFAATVTGLVVAVAIDALLPLMDGWSRNSAPPWASGVRLIDPVGLLFVGALLAVLTVVMARGPRTGKRRPVTPRSA
jgi:hypothetical protein